MSPDNRGGGKQSPPLVIMVVDDDLRMRELLGVTLAEEGFEPLLCGDSREAVVRLTSGGVDIVITDLMMPHFDGLEILEKARAANPDCMVILITGYGTIESAVAAIRQGAYDYIQKPFEPDDLLLILGRAVAHLRLLQENRKLRREVAGCRSEDLIGVSPPMEQLKDLVARVAPFDATILLQGETGTGKELVARLLHRWSKRAEHNFLPVNCGALPESLLESELFGHVRGAFTGAEQDRPGLFESVDHGTIFLDEINAISQNFQVKLLRVLQEGTFLKVGGREPVRVDVRVIAASNTPLTQEVAAGRFRSDLFYRLNVIAVDIPPLRRRAEDIPLLAHHFLLRYGAKYGKEIRAITPAALARLRGHGWPGNVRELENVLERAVIVADTPELGPEDLPPLGGSPEMGGKGDSAPGGSVVAMEKALIARTLAETGGHRGRTAEILGISPSSLWRKIKKYQLS
ncbi:sigma-54-dependent transcriptional regulator [Desulfurivibrio sp. D14AmB]|uniref:sigma-54-dependent transcriptional regulator n=1 Tax=Desulfurivibrio sp. D14AmB TaxID=3374370 RepID=UPI00376F0D4D